MDALTFIVETLKAAAWPLVTIVLAALFRSELRALLGRLKKGKVGAAELEFAEAVNELKAEVAEVSVASPRPPASARLADLAVLNPRAALMAAWTEIEMHLLRLSR